MLLALGEIKKLNLHNLLVKLKMFTFELTEQKTFKTVNYLLNTMTIFYQETSTDKKFYLYLTAVNFYTTTEK